MVGGHRRLDLLEEVVDRLAGPIRSKILACERRILGARSCQRFAVA
jgi:hypothetical protein